MLNRLIVLSTLATSLSLLTGGALAADPLPTPEKTQVQKQEKIYGSQLMTQQERNEHRTKMRAAKTADDRDMIRKAQHDAMKERAASRGVTLPDEPPVRGGGGGMGPGGGGGMGPGGGRGR